MEQNNFVELKVGDVYRENRARKLNKIVERFVYNDTVYFICTDVESDKKGYPHFFILPKDYLCGTREHYSDDGSYDGVVEVNGQVVRGKGGKVLVTPKVPKAKKSSRKETVRTSAKANIEPKTDFQKFLKVQRSGVINMTDIVNGSLLAGISEEKYEDIIWHYDEYEKGVRK